MRVVIRCLRGRSSRLPATLLDCFVRSLPSERLFGVDPLRNSIHRGLLAAGSRASAVLCVISGLPKSGRLSPSAYSARLHGCTRTALTRELEGKAVERPREAAAVGATFQGSTEKTWSRAGSPTRATCFTAPLQGFVRTDPTLSLWWGVWWGLGWTSAIQILRDGGIGFGPFPFSKCIPLTGYFSQAYS
jgi:hypothetical protein